eukprot:1150168-Pelagomonas_calceolata.AAC.4
MFVRAHPCLQATSSVEAPLLEGAPRDDGLKSLGVSMSVGAVLASLWLVVLIAVTCWPPLGWWSSLLSRWVNSGGGGGAGNAVTCEHVCQPGAGLPVASGPNCCHSGFTVVVVVACAVSGVGGGAGSAITCEHVCQPSAGLLVTSRPNSLSVMEHNR